MLGLCGSGFFGCRGRRLGLRSRRVGRLGFCCVFLLYIVAVISLVPAVGCYCAYIDLVACVEPLNDVVIGTGT